MKKFYLAFMVIAALVLASCTPAGNEPDALTKKVNPETEDFTRVLLIEQFTSQSCGNCPNGTQAIKNTIAGNESRVAWITHHAGYADDDYTMQESKALASFFKINAAPNMMLNRENQKYHDFGMDASGNPIIGQEMSSLVFHPAYSQMGGISTMYEDGLRQEGTASININKEMVDGKLRVGVYGAVKNEQKVCLNVVLIENNLKAKQYGPTGWDDNYIHNNVPRAFASAQLGDPVTLDAATYQKEYEITLNPTWKLENCELVVFVTKSNYKTVLNAAAVPVQ